MFKKGDVFYADLNNTLGSIQRGIRPVVVVSNNYFNNHSEAVTVVPLSTNMNKIFSTHVVIEEKCLKKKSKALCEQVMTISKLQVLQNIGSISEQMMNEINRGLKIQLSL